MTENVVASKKKHSVWYTEHKDSSPVSRLRFTEDEWKLILGAVGFKADSLVKEYHEHKRFWLDNECFTAYNSDPYSEKGRLWTFHTARCGEIKADVARLNLIERQLQLHFKMINRKFPEWLRTKDRMTR